MSRYILNPDIALRSWRLVPYAYYRKGVRYAKGLKKEEFEFLLKCDGKTELRGELPLAEKFSTCAVAIWLGAAIKQQKYNSHILPSAL